MYEKNICWDIFEIIMTFEKLWKLYCEVEPYQRLQNQHIKRKQLVNNKFDKTRQRSPNIDPTYEKKH